MTSLASGIEKGREGSEIELQKTLEKKFNLIFPKPLIEKLGKENEGIIWRIKGQFLINGGNLDLALDNAIGIQSGWLESSPSRNELTGWLHLSSVERKKLKEQILDLIQSLQRKDSKEGIPQVQKIEKSPKEWEQTSFDELQPYQKLPEYDMMKRLVEQGYIDQEKLDILGWDNIKTDSESIKRYYTELLQDPKVGLDEKVKATMLGRINVVDKKRMNQKK